uniref:Uncharacterized protein n=1 Tax=Anguilla anguilla TaxID=7936 RepID=A0A0E9R548_ANGAN
MRRVRKLGNGLMCVCVCVCLSQIRVSEQALTL